MKKNFKVVLGLVVVLFTLLSTLSTFQAFAVTSVTEAQFLDMCVRADNFMYNYGVVPLIVYTDSSQTDSVTAAEFFYMMSRWMRYYKNYSAPPTSVGITRGTGGPPSPSGIESGTIYKAELLNICKSHADFIDTNGRMANYTILSDGSHITPEAFFRVMSRTIKWFNDNGVLPNYTVVTAESAPSSWTGGGTPQPTPTPGSYP